MRISRVWRVSTSQDHYNYRGLFSLFFRGAENGPGRASNGRFGSPFSRLERGLRVLVVLAKAPTGPDFGGLGVFPARRLQTKSTKPSFSCEELGKGP